jgi:hypothetical protein
MLRAWIIVWTGVLILMGAGGAIGWHYGHANGYEQAVADIKSTCDDMDSKTVLQGKDYICADKPHFTATIEYVVKQILDNKQAPDSGT